MTRPGLWFDTRETDATATAPSIGSFGMFIVHLLLLFFGGYTLGPVGFANREWKQPTVLVNSK
jgi:hypothetical protein